MNNSWNKVVYKMWAPVYDRIFNQGQFLRARQQVFGEKEFRRQASMLVVGVGTGADLELLAEKNLRITAIDFSTDMLGKARDKFAGADMEFLEMDAQALQFADESFDYVAASLILSVVPDAAKCFRDMLRVLKPGGEIVIFDKFAPEGQALSAGKRLLRPVVAVLGTDIGLRFSELTQGEPVEIVKDEHVMMNGMYRSILIRKS